MTNANSTTRERWAHWATTAASPDREAVRAAWVLGPLTLLTDPPSPLCARCGLYNAHRYGHDGGPLCGPCRGGQTR